MKKTNFAMSVVFCLLLAIPAVPFQSEKSTPAAPRPIEVSDIQAWRNISSPTLSNDGQWFAYRIAPREGDGEVVVRKAKDAKELRFPAGSIPEGGARGAGGRGGQEGAVAREISFSEDSQWVVFTVHPNAREGRRGRGAGSGTTQAGRGAATPAATATGNKAVLLNLATEKKVEFERVRRAVFSAENPNWLVIQRNAAESQSGQAQPRPAGTAAAQQPERPSGTDLVLHDLNTGMDQNIGNVSEFAFDKKGQWLAWIVDAQDKAGNGIQLRNMATGVTQAIESDKAVYKSLGWTENGKALVALKGVEDSGYEDKLYSLVAFTGFPSQPQKIVFDPKEDKSVPAEMTVSSNRAPFFMEDLSGIVFGIQEARRKKEQPGRRGEESAARPDAASGEVGPPGRNRPETGPGTSAETEKPDLVIWHYLDKRLQSQQQVEEIRDRNYSYLCVYRVADKKFVRLSDDALRQVTVTPEFRYAIGSDNREYELMGSMDGRRYEDVYAVDLVTGTRKLVVKKSRWSFGASPDGAQFLYYDEGSFFVCDIAAATATNITKNVPVSFIDVEDDHNVVKPPVRPVGWAKGSGSVLLTDSWDIWNVPVRGGPAVNLTVNGKKDQIRYRNRIRLEVDEAGPGMASDPAPSNLYQMRGPGGADPKGIDLSKPLYFGTLAEATKKGGVARIEVGKPGAQMLLNDDAQFSGFMKAKFADVVAYTRATYKDYPDYYAADGSLKNGQKITDGYPQQKEFLWTAGSRLISYTSDKGDKLQGSLFLPANYEQGKKYPTIVYIYEKLTQNFNRYDAPTSNGFNKSVYTSNGYAVLEPDIVYKVNDPGMSAVWCVVPAVKAAIATGLVDPARVGIHGHSWGGYQTAFLITQTDIFRAAIAGAPLTNMISMYSSIYWNTGGGDNAIFESSQGRFLGGYWENLEAYQRNSPVYYAKNVKTPLMILHNDRDGAVDFNQGIEYFNTLRRLQKPVVMLQYRGENHGLRIPANQKDYTERMKEFFDHHLMNRPAPAWLMEGVPLMKIKEHVDQRLEEKAKANTLSTPAP